MMHLPPLVAMVAIAEFSKRKWTHVVLQKTDYVILLDVVCRLSVLIKALGPCMRPNIITSLHICICIWKSETVTGERKMGFTKQKAVKKK
jgi:hypothetical protein